MSDKPSLSVVLPCRNQGDHIGEILPRYLAPLESLGIPFELITVPNASTDNTQTVIEELACHDPRIRVVVNPLGGWGRSVCAGLDTATGNILTYTNTARTDPVTLPQFIQRYLENSPCLVKARRTLRKSPLRELGSFLYNVEGRALFNIGAHDMNGTPKVFSSDLYHTLQLGAVGDLLDLEIMAKVARLRMPIVEIPVIGFQRHGGKSTTTFKSAWKMYVGALKLWLQLRRAQSGTPSRLRASASSMQHDSSVT